MKKYIQLSSSLIITILLFSTCKKETTPPDEALLLTNNVTNIGITKAKSGGYASSKIANDITRRGVCWDTLHSPSLQHNFSNQGKGHRSYESNLIDLKENTKYYVRAYIITSTDTLYGNEKSFTTTNNFLKETPCKIDKNTLRTDKPNIYFEYTIVEFGNHKLKHGNAGMYALDLDSEIWIGFDEFPVSGKYTLVNSSKDLSANTCMATLKILNSEYISNVGDTVYFNNDGGDYSLSFCNVKFTSKTSSATFVCKANLTEK